MYLTKTWFMPQNFAGQAGNSKKPAYFAGFVAFRFAFFSRGCGGVLKNLRAMSSMLCIGRSADLRLVIL